MTSPTKGLCSTSITSPSTQSACAVRCGLTFILSPILGSILRWYCLTPANIRTIFETTKCLSEKALSNFPCLGGPCGNTGWMLLIQNSIYNNTYLLELLALLDEFHENVRIKKQLHTPYFSSRYSSTNSLELVLAGIVSPFRKVARPRLSVLLFFSAGHPSSSTPAHYAHLATT